MTWETKTKPGPETDEDFVDLQGKTWKLPRTLKVCFCAVCRLMVFPENPQAFNNRNWRTVVNLVRLKAAGFRNSRDFGFGKHKRPICKTCATEGGWK